MNIIYRKVYSLLKLTFKRAPFVVVLDDLEFVCRHCQTKCHDGGLSGGGTLSHPSIEDPYRLGAPPVGRTEGEHDL